MIRHSVSDYLVILIEISLLSKPYYIILHSNQWSHPCYYNILAICSATIIRGLLVWVTFREFWTEPFMYAITTKMRTPVQMQIMYIMINPHLKNADRNPVIYLKTTKSIRWSLFFVNSFLINICLYLGKHFYTLEPVGIHKISTFITWRRSECTTFKTLRIWQ